MSVIYSGLYILWGEYFEESAQTAQVLELGQRKCTDLLIIRWFEVFLLAILTNID